MEWPASQVPAAEAELDGEPVKRDAGGQGCFGSAARSPDLGGADLAGQPCYFAILSGGGGGREWDPGGRWRGR